MYENNNKAVIRELAMENFKTHRSRNVMAVLAIFLMTVLLTTVFTVGFSLLYTGGNAAEQTPGPASDGYIVGGAAHYERVLAMEQVQWADFVQKCSRTPLHNAVFGGVETRLFAPDDHFYHDNLITLKEGAYPQKANEIMISDTLAQRLGTEGKIHQPFVLEVMVGPQGEEQKQFIEMTICGIYHNPLFVISDVYDEIYTSTAFIPLYNPEIDQNDHIIYVKLSNLNPLLMKTDVSASLSVIAEETDAPGYSAGKNTGVFYSALIAILPVLFFVLLLMGSGYFLIYNVFYISIVNDIRWFGLLKTIGATTRQLRAVLYQQVRILAMVGVALGAAAGYLLGLVFSPKVLAMTDWALYYEAPSFVWVAVFAVIFAVVTVWISARKPLKLAASISPIEAQHFTPKGGKNIFTVLSLALSGVIFLVTCNLSIGYQPEVIVDRYNQNDYQISHKGALWTLQEPYEPIKPSMVQELQALPFVEKVDVIYHARTHHDIDLWGNYPVSMGEVAAEGKLWLYYDGLRDLQATDDGVYAYIGLPVLNERGNLALSIAGLPAHRLTTEAVNYRLLEGQLDEAVFAQGDQVILNVKNSAYDTGERTKKEDVHAGDVLQISFYDEQTKQYTTKDLTVMAVVEAAYAYTSSDVRQSDLILSDTLFKSIYSNNNDMIGALQITAKEELTAGQIGEIQKLQQKAHNNQLIAFSRYSSRLSALRDQQTYGLIGFFLAGILAVIGISNVMNTVTANVLAHKLEYAAMQSVGMTRRQLRKFLVAESGKYCGLALAIMLPLGGYLTRILAQNPFFTGFHGGIFAVSAFFAAVVLLLICFALSWALVQVLNKHSIVERLREIV